MVALSTAGSSHALCGATKRYPDVCAHQLFEQQVDRTPDAVAVIHEGRRLTYRELDERANRLARFLRKQGVNAEGLVGVCMQRVPELAVALLGVWKAGAAYVPIDPAYPRDRVSFMIGDAGIHVLLTDRSCEDRFGGAGVETVCVDGSHATRIASEEGGRPAVSVGPSGLAYVMYTSGSTGQPKGAMIVHSGLVNYLCWAIEAYGVEAGGSVPVHSSIAFDLTVTSLYPALLAGGEIELLPEDVGAQNLLAALRRTRGRNLVKITPAHLDVLTRLLRPEELAGMTKLFVIGGENLPAESLSAWRDLAPGTRFVNEYGPTETVVGCCIHEVRESDPRNGSVPIGLPIANTQLYLLDPDLRPVAAGATGELYIGGAGVARGYLNRPELTRERFLPDPFAAGGSARMYKTGDLARRRPDGLLEFLGRIDNQVKVRGYRIELGEIEAALASHPDVASSAVLAREDSPGNKQLVGYLVPHEGRTVATQQVQEFLGGRLPEYMVPPRLVVLASMPLTVNGKVDRSALPAPSDAEAAAKPALRPPRDETQRAVAEVWRELLEVEDIGLESDFFELGGHSLAAVKALAMMRDQLGVDLDLGVLFEHSTLEAFAAQVAAARGTAPEAPRIPPRGKDGPCPVSPAQEQMWLLNQLAPESPAYNIPDVIPLPGKYDAQALRRALAELVARHEALRTTFSRESGELVQIVHAPFAPEVREVDLRKLAEAERQGEWDRVVREQARAKFDLSRLPLLRATVVHRSEGDHQLLFTVHHIVSDEWSMELVHREIGELYAAFVQGRPPKLDPLPIQYADYAVWQRAQMQGDELRKQLDYWTQDLKGAPTGLALPLDRPHPETPSDRGSTERFELSPDLSERLQALCREEQATLFMALEAAFAALLHRISGQEDILVGTPISNRTQAETQGLIGCFLNTVVLRTRFQGDSTFRSLLRQVRTSALGAYAHAELPFERLVAALSPAREPGRTPLFQVMFVLHDRDGVVSKVWSDRALQTDTSKFDMTLFVTQSGKGLAGVVEYSTEVFERETIRRICRSYARLLDSLVRGPDREIAALPMLAEADRQQLLSEWNDTAVAFDDGATSLHELLSRQAARTPDRTAVSCQGRTLSYGELDRRSDRLARHLVSLGVGPDVLVGLVFERSVDMMVGLVGVLKAGGAYVPLDPSFPAERLAHMIEDSRMPVLVTHGAARDVVESLPSRPRDVVWLDRDLPEPVSEGGRTVPARVALESLAYVLYTSGSTGKPKGVAIPHSAL
ncbi:MAG TPA: amino acid adenylation domain-containing protein, partial [Polyangiaceae bacterium]